MTSPVFTLHCALVFGVPALFGWVLLRRVFREANLLALIGGSVIGGAAALMAAVNELRFYFEMGQAVWFAYKFLLVGTLIMLVTLRPRCHRIMFPGCVRSPWKRVLIALGTACTAVYFGIPAFGGFLHDAWWFHYPAVVQIQNVSRFPLNHVFALDGPLYYHHGPDILAATWSFLLELPVQKAWALYIVVLAPCSFLLAFSLLARLARNYWGALIGASLLVIGGNLRFLFFLTGDYSGTLGSLQVFNSQTVQGFLQLMFTPSHALGVPLVLLILLQFRHVAIRTSWLLAGALGLTLGTVTLVAEWYFLPLAAGITAVLWLRAWRLKSLQSRPALLTLAILPAAVALGWGAFNNTYLSGLFGHFWMRYDNITTLASARQNTALWQQPIPFHQAPAPLASAPFAPIKPLPFEVATSTTPPAYQPKWSVPNLVPLSLNLKHFGQVPSWESAASESDSFIPVVQAPAPLASAPFAPIKPLPFEVATSTTPPAYQPKWSVPNLVPLSLNLKHLGQVPSWESAASNGESFIPVVSFKFLAEAAPVLLLGIPFGLWLAWRRRQPVVIVLAWLAASCALPPLLLDWGYRSTDFLRFFTASYSFAALFTGWLAGELIARPHLRARLLGALLTTCCLITPIGLGVIGLMPGTIEKVNAIAAGARSLSQAAATEKSASANSVAGSSATNASAPKIPGRAQAFEKLAVQTGNFIFPLSHGRERAIVIVPIDQIPEVKYFPEWMKLATLSRLPLPVGWHWQDSEYSAYYREAATRLDARAITSLDAKWVIVSNLFQETIPDPVVQVLRDRTRFFPVATFREGKYFMSAFRVLP